MPDLKHYGTTPCSCVLCSHTISGVPVPQTCAKVSDVYWTGEGYKSVCPDGHEMYFDELYLPSVTPDE